MDEEVLIRDSFTELLLGYKVPFTDKLAQRAIGQYCLGILTRDDLAYEVRLRSIALRDRDLDWRP